jgi:alpha-beta hydrolase superfamily lysophospholipase
VITAAPCRALYIDARPDATFAIFHPARGAGSATAVLIVPPFGWDEVASYRARRAWAEDLAAAGHATLRLDLPGAGDSAGSPHDPGRLSAWTAAVEACARWLLAESSAHRLAVVGLGLGGLVAAHALAGGAPIDDLVLWAVPAQGRSLVREARAFSRLQTSALGASGNESVLEVGAIEVGGFVLSAETIAAMGGIDLATAELSGLSRALLLGRDGIEVDASLARHMRESGIEVRTGAGVGWGAMCFHPERFHPPVEVMREVSAWLVAAEDRQPVPHVESRPTPPAAAGELRHADGGSGFTESVLEFDGPSSRLFAVLDLPEVDQRAPVSVVFLNAGAVRRIGPNRLWVEAARRFAERGVASLRVDVEGLGDSEGDAGRNAKVANLYRPALADQVRAFLDQLQERGLGPPFLLIGLCAGGYWAFQTAAQDERVASAVLLNAGALVWDPELISRRDARSLRLLAQRGGWRRMLRGEVSPARMLAVARAAARTRWRAARRVLARNLARFRSQPSQQPVDLMLNSIAAHGARLVLAFSAGEPLMLELEADGMLARLGSWPNVAVVDLPAADHTVRPIVAQNAVHDLLDAELQRVLDAPLGAPAARVAR